MAVMRKGLIAGLAGMLVLLLVGAFSARPHVTIDSPPDEQSVRAAHLEWTKAWIQKNLDAIVNHYAEDADMELADSSIVRGNRAIRLGIKQAFADPFFELKMTPDSVEVSRAGDLAFVRGTYTKTITDSATKRPVTVKGDYLVVYRSDGRGGWRAIHDICNRQPQAA